MTARGGGSGGLIRAHLRVVANGRLEKLIIKVEKHVVVSVNGVE